MIAAVNPQEFEPYGREYCKRHPGDVHLSSPTSILLKVDQNLQLLSALKDVSLKDKFEYCYESWQLQAIKDCPEDSISTTEELYVLGKTVVWSKGGCKGAWHVCKTFTVDHFVQQALWCNFFISNNKPSILIDNTDINQDDGKFLPSICIIDNVNVNVFTTKGEDYITALPFQVAKAWPMKYGLLLERAVTPQEISNAKRDIEQLPTLFSMLHPLDEITPVVTNSSGIPNPSKTCYVNDQHLYVIFTSTNPSLIMTYSSVLGVHTVWKLRRAKAEEMVSVSKVADTPSNYFQSLNHTPQGATNSSSFSRFTLSSHSPCQNSMSPLRNYSSRVNSPIPQSRPQSPSISNITHMAALSRSQSPSASGGNMYRYTMTANPAPIPRSPAVTGKMIGTSISAVPGLMEPLAPDICLESLWTEPMSGSKDSLQGKASKAFLTSDFVGQNFLCLLVPTRNQLRCMKYEESNDKSNLIFGVVTTIPARDAAPLENSDMMLVLDVTSTLILYSGIVKVCKVHVPNLPYPPSRSSIGNISRLLIQSEPDVQRRSSLITSSRPASSLDARFDEEVNLLSPVQSDFPEPTFFNSSYLDDHNMLMPLTVIGIRGSEHNRAILEYDNGLLFKITIPKVLGSTLVSTCLQAIRNVLPKELTLQFYVKWYSTLNALGSSNGSCGHEWSTFVACLLGMMGYDLEHLPVTKKLQIDIGNSPIVLTKKFKSGDTGNEEDWLCLLESSQHTGTIVQINGVLGLQKISPILENESSAGLINSSAALFPHIPAILYALHLVYEDLKLNALLWNDLSFMVLLLIQLARDLRVQSFLDHYWRDFPNKFIKDATTQIDEAALKSMHYPPYLTPEPPSIFQWLYDYLIDKNISPFPYISQVCSRTKNIIMLYTILRVKGEIDNLTAEKYLKKISGTGIRDIPILNMDFDAPVNHPDENVHELMVEWMTQLGIKNKDLECLPVGVALPLRNAIFQCRRNPPSSWPEEAYCLIGRQDLSAQLKAVGKERLMIHRSKKLLPSSDNKKPILTKEDDDGMEHLDYEVLKLRFNSDQRIQEVRRLLQSSKPVRISLIQRPEVSDHDFIEEQERHLYALCMRTMALPVGRGMFTLRTSQPVVTETLPIPKLCLTGRAPPRNTSVDLSHIETMPNMNMWPLFHNGVAAGLRIMPNASQIDSTWIRYNRPKGSNDMPMEHAGFLMALGLNGHLSDMATLNIHDYLCKGHEMTSVGLLLGIAAAKRGTMDIGTTKLLSIHVEALLPPTSTELDIPHVVQVAAILGVGLVYEGTAHRHMAEILLSEIGRPPGPEMENSMDRESYSLAAGLALGLVTFGCGNEVAGLLDLSMADQLYHYMVGGHKRPLTGMQKEKYKSPSYQIKEGDSVNIDVTSPGAALALGMMYFKTGNRAVAEWMTAPDTQFLLDFVRPDFLLLRTLSKGLIMWDNVHPSVNWVNSHVPEIISRHAFKKGQEGDDIDRETMSQVYCNILAGACMALGLRFAGSANDEAYNTLMKYAKMFINLSGKPVADQAGRSTIETCLNVIVLSLAMVMSGTGNLEVLRICRYLHSRVGQSASYVLYGSHMAIHIAIGLLFLGGGKYTLSTNGSAIAAMICAFFPKFPTHSNDNRYHLQAFRHLYVLAVEPRLIISRDIDTGKVCYTHLTIKFKDTQWYQNVQYDVKAPCMLPELNQLEEIWVNDSRYWPIQFHCDKNWNSLKSLLENHGVLYVKQKAGCLSYVEDPKGFRSLLAQSLTKDNTGNWSVKPEAIEAFSSDSSILNFAKYFLHLENCNKNEGELKQFLCGVLYECVTQEKTEILFTCIALIQVLHQLQYLISTNGLWQIKLVRAFSCHSLANGGSAQENKKHLLNPEFILAIHSRIERILSRWHQDNKNSLIDYLIGKPLTEGDHSLLATFLVYNSIPRPQELNHSSIKGTQNLAGLYLQMKDLNLPVSSVMKLLSTSL